MNQKNGIGISVGGASILMIFVVLCLTVFGTLSVVTANADNKLTQKTLGVVTAYYEADTKAEEILAKVDEKLLIARENVSAWQENGMYNEDIFGQVDLEGKNAGQVYQALYEKLLSSIPDVQRMDNLTYRYSVPAENGSLYVVFRVSAGVDATKRYQVESWKFQSGQNWEYEEGELDLWDGGAI